MQSEKRETVRAQVLEAGGPAAQIWPLKTFAYRNPVRGYEHLPFDEAVREAARVIGGAGYLPNGEYRGFFQEGRITAESLRLALAQLGPRIAEDPVRTPSRTIAPDEILWAHLTAGIEAVEPNLLEWTANTDGQAELLQSALAAAAALNGKRGSPAPGADLPKQRTLSDWLDELTGSSVVATINEQMTKWSAAFLDEGMAGWGMPTRSSGFYASWRELAARDWSGRFLGIPDFARKIAAWPDSPEDAVALGLERLQVPPERWSEYEARMIAHLPGWTGFVRWRSENPQYPGQHEHPVDLVQYLAARLFYEVELVDAVCRREFGIAGTLPALRERLERQAGDVLPAADERALAGRLYALARRLEVTPEQLRELTPEGARTLLGWVDQFPADRHGPVWLEAYENSYRLRLVAKMRGHWDQKGSASDARPHAQLVFCIDARSEPFRRHLEAQGPYETFGYAGFFGVPISHQAFDGHDRLALCPVLLKPGRSVDEVPREGEEGSLERYASGTRWRRLGDDLFHDLKQNPVGSFMLVDSLGVLFSAGLAGKTLINQAYSRCRDALRSRFRSEVKTKLPLERVDSEAGGVPVGFALEEQAKFVGNGLRMIGLTAGFGRLVVLCGHGAESENNPYAAAYNCGACGGAHGDPNARAFAAMANSPDVRRLLAAQGLAIPDDVRFLAAKHDTTTDRVAFYDVIDLPSSHADDLRRLEADLAEAGARQASERLSRLPGVQPGLPPERAARAAWGRSVDWSNPRPEWGLSSNAAFLIGRRALTKGLDLDSRVFLHSYDPDSDPDGGILGGIMTAPLVVGEWINMEYYFSAVDPWVYGSGSKVIHNVVGGIGVMLGSQSDLQGGLPVQGIADGARRYHEPMRLLAIIEAPRTRISELIQKHAALQTLFHNQWVNLLALEPASREFHRYNADATWARLPTN